MKQINKVILIAVIALVAGGAIGFLAGQRSAGVGPLAGLQGNESAAALSGPANQGLCNMLQYDLNYIRENDDGSAHWRQWYNSTIRAYNQNGCGR